jgi:hypothetical protein
MPSRIHKAISRFLVVCYVLAGVLLEVGHHDQHELGTDPHPSFAAHGCGAHEVHLPLDKRHDCLACAQSTVRLGVAGIVLTPDCLQPLFVGDFSTEAGNTQCRSSLTPDQRGPPLV